MKLRFLFETQEANIDLGEKSGLNKSYDEIEQIQ